ncbi:ABC transporter permease [Rathayibacter sp. VKM Ac-2760]|uniref:ABC transporter permease n=1 Tax=Rathayibacter sp. VKM Ac-2760 TaxID=2609253 RepID=UPI001316CB5A|nr:ABC transporter permease [Rathayibacter sp. VKM Ac-2760]QHC60400.1 ABC transporter permease subunit [Rathayibacter sp. VKM Ac-2760]
MAVLPGASAALAPRTPDGVARLARRVGKPVLRVLGAVLVIVGIVSITFLISRVFTADPVNLFVGNSATDAMREQARQDLGLGDPLIVQYLRFLGGLFSGDLGQSYLTGRAVTADLLGRMPATIELGLYAVLLGLVSGIVVGVIAAVARGTVLDGFLRLVTTAGLSLPQFWVGLMLLWLFFVTLRVAPGPSGRLPIGVEAPGHITGLYVVDAILQGDWATATIASRQLVLPVICLAVGSFAPIARQVRSAMVDSLDSDYIRTARAMGISRPRVWFSYALKPGLLSVLTIGAGLIGWTLAGSVLVEGIFAWPGIGQLALTSIQSSDYPVIQGFVLYVAILYVVIWALLEGVYARVDPRVHA